MTLTPRRILSGAFWLAGLALLALVDRSSPDFAGGLAATACFWASIGLSLPDRRALAERGPSIPWGQRDAGEKFSIIMFHVIIGTGGLFAAWLLAGFGEDSPAPLWRIALAAALVTIMAWKFWRNWTMRNAG